jgi:two-component system sensor histidine kinase KdpD
MRGSNERAKHTKGMGLGLYLSKHLVEAHGGRVWIEQPPDGGTHVRFTLPLEEC